MNKVILMGRLTATPELKQTQRGVAVTSATIAVNRQFVKAGEARQADFIPIVAWRNTAEFLCKYFTKGQQVAVVGTLQNREWTDKDNSKRRTAEVIVDEVYFADSKREGGRAPIDANPSGSSDFDAPLSHPVYAPATADFEEITEDGELPF